jgi:TRAP-type transport system small permease protein
MNDSPPPDKSDPIAARGFALLASLVLAGMAVVAFADVVLRMANKPITGAYELTAMLMGLLVYAALPLVTVRDEHVRAGVMLMWTGAPLWLGRLMRELRRALSAVALGYLAWALLQYMFRMAETGDRAPYIEIPLAWVAGFGAVAMALSAWMALWARQRKESAP